MATLPKEVSDFITTLERFVAVSDVGIGLKRLEEFPPSSYSLPAEFGDLPHALLRRTDGGLKDEFWVNVEFDLARDEAGWLTLEFLAWWVRDLTRSDVQVQLRPMALPPVAYETQLGRTLKFIIDFFVICPDGETKFALEMLKEHNESLAGNIKDYAKVLGALVHPTKKKRG